MNANELLARLKEDAKAGKNIDWKAMREEIHTIAEGNIDMEERVVLLQIFGVLMDAMEGDLKSDGGDIDAFKDARKKDYNLLLIREALIGENVSVEFLGAITKREVEAGRMSDSDEMRQIAIRGLSEPHVTVAQLFHIEQKRLKEEKGWRRWFSKKDAVKK